MVLLVYPLNISTNPPPPSQKNKVEKKNETKYISATQVETYLLLWPAYISESQLDAELQLQPAGIPESQLDT